MGSEMNATILPIIQIVEGMNEEGISSRLGKALAKLIRELYTSLVDEGFSEEEALKILCSVGSSFKAGQ